MSEDFDKEAERQRLREKYESNEEDREVTERMSELLLQGATMTNRHCDTCGSPLFRYQGQEFCPTCQMEAAAGDQDGRAVEADVQTDAPDAPDAPNAPNASNVSNAPNAPDEPVAGTSPETHRSDRGQGRESEGRRGDDERMAATQAEAESLEEVRALLTRTLARFARRAAETEDPHRAREHLKTAQSAAETLRAVPR